MLLEAAPYCDGLSPPGIYCKHEIVCVWLGLFLSRAVCCPLCLSPSPSLSFFLFSFDFFLSASASAYTSASAFALFHPLSLSLTHFPFLSLSIYIYISLSLSLSFFGCLSLLLTRAVLAGQRPKGSSHDLRGRTFFLGVFQTCRV